MTNAGSDSANGTVDFRRQRGPDQQPFLAEAPGLCPPRLGCGRHGPLSEDPESKAVNRHGAPLLKKEDFMLIPIRIGYANHERCLSVLSSLPNQGLLGYRSCCEG